MILFNKINIFSFQSPATPVMEGIIDLHNYIFFYLILVFVFVLWMYGYILYSFYLVPTLFFDFLGKNNEHSSFIRDLILRISTDAKTYKKIMAKHFLNYVYTKHLNVLKTVLSVNAISHMKELLETRQIVHGTIIEIVWTVVPSFILIFIALPSFALLYSMDEITDPRLTVKVIGYQWYWSYEYAHMNLLPTDVEPAMEGGQSNNSIESVVEEEESNNNNIELAIEKEESSNIELAIEKEESSNIELAIEKEESSNIELAIEKEESSNIELATGEELSNNNIESVVEEEESNNIESIVEEEESNNNNIELASEEEESNNIELATGEEQVQKKKTIRDLIGDREVISDTLTYESVMIAEDDLVEGYYRLLDVDKPMILPARTYVRVIVTSEDVLHSWAVPSLGIKIDAVPGRLSQVGVLVKHSGVFYGQCSELCGVGHGFMPIVVKVLDADDFLVWNKNLVGFEDTLK